MIAILLIIVALIAILSPRAEAGAQVQWLYADANCTRPHTIQYTNMPTASVPPQERDGACRPISEPFTRSVRFTTQSANASLWDYPVVNAHAESARAFWTQSGDCAGEPASVFVHYLVDEHREMAAACKNGGGDTGCQAVTGGSTRTVCRRASLDFSAAHARPSATAGFWTILSLSALLAI